MDPVPPVELPGLLAPGLAIAGLVIGLVWMLLRRQKASCCRACGYDRTGLPSVRTLCPECGSPANGRAWRCRRRLPPLLVGALLVSFGIGVEAYRRAYQRSTYQRMPNWMLVRLMDDGPRSSLMLMGRRTSPPTISEVIGQEVQRRSRDDLWGVGEWRMIVRRIRSRLDASVDERLPPLLGSLANDAYMAGRLSPEDLAHLDSHSRVRFITRSVWPEGTSVWGRVHTTHWNPYTWSDEITRVDLGFRTTTKGPIGRGCKILESPLGLTWKEQNEVLIADSIADRQPVSIEIDAPDASWNLRRVRSYESEISVTRVKRIEDAVAVTPVTIADERDSYVGVHSSGMSGYFEVRPHEIVELPDESDGTLGWTLTIVSEGDVIATSEAWWDMPDLRVRRDREPDGLLANRSRIGFLASRSFDPARAVVHVQCAPMVALRDLDATEVLQHESFTVPCHQPR